MGDQTRTVELKATVVSGRGLAGSLRAADVAELSKRQEIPLVDGSLNLVLSSPIWLDASRTVYVGETGHFYWQAELNGIPIVLNRWSCPAHILEAYSTTHIRSKLNLEDGDRVTLSIPLNTVTPKRARGHETDWCGI